MREKLKEFRKNRVVWFWIETFRRIWWHLPLFVAGWFSQTLRTGAAYHHAGKVKPHLILIDCSKTGQSGKPWLVAEQLRMLLPDANVFVLGEGHLLDETPQAARLWKQAAVVITDNFLPPYFAKQQGQTVFHTGCAVHLPPLSGWEGAWIRSALLSDGIAASAKHVTPLFCGARVPDQTVRQFAENVVRLTNEVSPRSPEVVLICGNPATQPIAEEMFCHLPQTARGVFLVALPQSDVQVRALRDKLESLSAPFLLVDTPRIFRNGRERGQFYDFCLAPNTGRMKPPRAFARWEAQRLLPGVTVLESIWFGGRNRHLSLVGAMLPQSVLHLSSDCMPLNVPKSVLQPIDPLIRKRFDPRDLRQPHRKATAKLIPFCAGVLAATEGAIRQNALFLQNADVTHMPMAATEIVPFAETTVNGVRYAVAPESLDLFGTYQFKYIPLDGAPIFATVGGCTAASNHAFLIKAFEAVTAHFPRAKLYIIGNGELRLVMQEDLKLRNTSVVFVSSLQDPGGFLPHCDCYVSAATFDALGRATQQARLLGKPAVLADLPENRAAYPDATFCREDVRVWGEAMLRAAEQIASKGGV